jgi:predicted ArsR family transcriptional regulator
MTAPFQKHSDTSRAAADAIEPRMNAQHGRILGYLTGRGPTGATDEEIALDLGIAPSTARPRRVELQRMGKAKDSGRRKKTEAGRPAVVWIACDEPAAVVRDDARRLKLAALRHAMEPFLIKARMATEDFPHAHDRAVVQIRQTITMGQLRELIRAWEA